MSDWPTGTWRGIRFECYIDPDGDFEAFASAVVVDPGKFAESFPQGGDPLAILKACDDRELEEEVDEAMLRWSSGEGYSPPDDDDDGYQGGGPYDHA